MFVYDRGAIANGEFWRLLTGHLVHSDINHLIMNVIASSMILPFVGCLKRLFLSTVGLALLISSGLWLFVPDIHFYCGASALLNGMLIFALWEHWRKEPHWVYGLVFLGAVSKTILEIVGRQSVFDIYHWPPLPESHLLGMIAAGVLIILNHMKVKVSTEIK